MIVEPSRNCCIAGPRFELSAEDVIAWCEDLYEAPEVPGDLWGFSF